MRNPPQATSLLSGGRQLERLRMCCVVAVAVVAVVVDDVVAGVGDGCHSGSGVLKWQRDQRAGSRLGCKDCLPRPPCPQRGRPYRFCNRVIIRTSQLRKSS